MRPRNSILLGVCSGILLVICLPKPDLYPLAWIALVPLLYAGLLDNSALRVVIAAYSAGVVFFAGTCYWFAETMNIYGGLPMGLAAGVAILFSVTWALYFAFFGFVFHLLVRKFGARALLIAPALWVTIELARTFLFSGFPWMLFGYALVPYPGVLQMASWTGVYGLSFIVVAVNAAIAYALALRRWAWIVPAGAAIAASWLLPVFGETASNDPVSVRLVQTNISIDQPWREPSAGKLMDELGELSAAPFPSLQALQALQANAPRLIVWPEVPAPFYLAEDAAFRLRMENIAQKAGAYFLLGYIGMTGDSPSNSAAVLSPRGEAVTRYDKIHLVPFGEYVPFKKLLFFAESLTRQVGDFTPGAEYTVSSLDNHRISAAICYESIFPDLVRQFVKQGSELIVVITNDGWFGESSAPYQHLRMGIVRAVENRRYIVRTANTGISAIIDPYGRIEASTPIGVRTVLDGVAHFRSERTFYTEYGDVFAYLNALCVGVALLVGLSGRECKPDRAQP